MATYVISDIHGCYEMFMRMLKKINFSINDKLYVLGDVIDRGPAGIKCLLFMMECDNIVPFMGNHCDLALPCMQYLSREDEGIEEKEVNKIASHFLNWSFNGGENTLNEFKALELDERKEVLDYIEKMKLFDEINVNNQDYVLVHAGFDNFDENKKLHSYNKDDLLWHRTDYSKQYFSDKITITGHTPTSRISSCDTKGYIHKANNHIAIDCGCSYRGGRLGCIRLDDMAEFYVERL